jgi:hypothetical protein
LKESEDFVDASIVYPGYIVKTLHLMVSVAADCLQLWQNFPNKKTVSLRFAEEAIQVSKNIVFRSVNNTFLTGILFATGASFSMVPYLQKVIQADAAYVHFGKYPLFSAYGSTASGLMFPIVFAIMFGNETKDLEVCCQAASINK